MIEKKGEVRLIVGTDNGLMKSLCITEQPVVATFGEQVIGREVEALCSGGEAWDDYEKVVAGYKGGEIRYVDLSGGERDGETYLLQQPTGNCKVVGLEWMDGKAVWMLSNGELHSASIASVEEQADTLSCNLGGPLDVMRLNRDTSQFAIGGKERDLSLFDLNTQKNLWKAKNVAHNFLDMQVPVWVKDIRFFSPSCISICTHYQQIRIYDIRQQRRPVVDYKMKEENLGPFNCMASKNDVIFTGDTKGNLFAIDHRKSSKVLGRYRGPAGSIRAVQTHPDVDRVACVGLDRYVRVFDISSRKLQHKFYLKQRLCSLLFSPLPVKEETGSSSSSSSSSSSFSSSSSSYSSSSKKRKRSKKKKTVTEEEERLAAEDDAIWAKLEQQAAKKKKKRKK